MVSVPALLAFLPVAALIVVAPGPSVLFAVGRSLSGGLRSGLRTVVGNGVGLLLQVVVIALGLGALLARAGWGLTVLRVAGGAYLVWLGLVALRRTRSHGGARPAPHLSRRRQHGRAPSDLLAGFVVGVTNPKTLVFLTALLPQFVVPGRAATGQVLLLGTVFVLLAVAGDSLWAAGAARAGRTVARTPALVRRVEATGAVALLGLGTWTLVSGTRSR